MNVRGRTGYEALGRHEGSLGESSKQFADELAVIRRRADLIHLPDRNAGRAWGKTSSAFVELGVSVE